MLENLLVLQINKNTELFQFKKCSWWNHSNFFIVKVEGTSMNDFMVNRKYIENGSYACPHINKEKVINTKDAFLFVVDNAATLKIPKKEGKNLYLIPWSMASMC
ncbi:MAG: S24 family peptidase [Sphingobium sp.]|nr:S24 family peptidase [Sphingobium sp.]